MAEKAKFNIKNNLDVIVPFGVIGIVLMIIIPLPPALLDVIITFNKSIYEIIIRFHTCL